MMHVAVNELASRFATRPAGRAAHAALAPRLERIAATEEQIDLDFTKVAFASFSFIDELVAPIVRDPRFADRLTVSASQPSVSRAVARSRAVHASHG